MTEQVMRQTTNLSTAAPDPRVLVKLFPELVDGAPSRPSTNVKQNANVGVEDRPKGIEEPWERRLVRIYHPPTTHMR